MAFEFKFELKLLNHLGRGLYRNFASVVAEAISNSWDAGATKVRIEINVKKKEMIIFDNGEGMNESDFQNKFLKVGYSRREGKGIKTNQETERKILGRKGIGKLALLTISKKVTIRSKKSCTSEEVGGMIDNDELDKEIKEMSKYELGILDIKNVFNRNEKGTHIKFEGIKEIVNRPEIIKKYLAVLFNFSFSFNNEQFDIYVNSKKVSIQDLERLNSSTEYLWVTNLKDRIKDDLSIRFIKVKKTIDLPKYKFNDENNNEYELSGFVASVFRPSDIQIRGTKDRSVDNKGFKAGLHLFVNGRLRQENIFLDIPARKIGEDYLYGEIHIDSLDDGDDIFTSSREGLIKDGFRYNEYIIQLRKIQSAVLNEWNRLRSERKKQALEKITGDNELKPERQEVVDKLMNSNEANIDINLRKFLKVVLPPPSPGKRILICHSKKDKKQARIIYKKLINEYGFVPTDFIFTNGPDEITRIPAGKDIYKYLRTKFIPQKEWYSSSIVQVVYIVSEAMEKSWNASLEAGAAWVARTDHYPVLTSKYPHRAPPDPIKTKELFIRFKNHVEFEDNITAKSVFENIRKKFQNL